MVLIGGLRKVPVPAYDGKTYLACGVPGMSTAVKAPPTMPSRDSQSPVLVAMADTFIGGMGHPGSPIRVAASMEETFARLPSEADRRRLRLLVGILRRRSGPFLFSRPPGAFSPPP